MQHEIQVLMLEDSSDWGELIERVVSSLEWGFEWRKTPEDALAAALNNSFDIIIVDRMIGSQEEGVRFIKTLKRYEITSMIIVTSQLSTTTEKVSGLAAGADDYLAKPFEKEELHARLIALARRVGKWSKYPSVRLAGDLEIRHGARTVSWRGESIRLADQLFDLLWLLSGRINEVVQREEIWREVWPDFSGLPPQHNTIEAAIGRLRKQLSEVTNASFIESVRGRGYRFHGPK